MAVTKILARNSGLKQAIEYVLNALFPPAVILQDDIPVLRLLNNEDGNPPWGRIARITI